MPQRYQPSPAYRDPGAINTGTAGSLAQTLEQFRGVATAIGTDIATRRGAEAGAESSDPNRSNFTAFGRAYNDAALRNYLIDQYTEIEREMARIESESGSDAEVFARASEGLRDGMLAEALPQAKGAIREMHERRLGEGLIRIDERARTEQREYTIGQLGRGLDTVADSISRKIASGHPGLMAQAQEEEIQLQMMLDGAVASGDISPEQGESMLKEYQQNITRQAITGQFEASDDPIAFLNRLADPNTQIQDFSDEDREQMLATLLQRLNRRQALAGEATAVEDASRRARWADGESVATVATLRGEMTVERLAQMIERDQLDPGIARTLYNELQTGSKGVDDPQALFQVRTRLLDYTEAEIAQMSELTQDTRADLILERREISETWRNDQAAKEAERRIDVALGIPSGLGPQYQIAITEEKATAAANARTYFYDLVEATPEAERTTGTYFELADQAIRDMQTDITRGELESAQNRLRSYQERMGNPSDMSTREREEYDTTVQRLEGDIERLRGNLNAGR